MSVRSDNTGMTVMSPLVLREIYILNYCKLTTVKSLTTPLVLHDGVTTEDCVVSPVNTPSSAPVAVVPDQLVAALLGLYFSSGPTLHCVSVSGLQRVGRLDI